MDGRGVKHESGTTSTCVAIIVVSSADRTNTFNQHYAFNEIVGNWRERDRFYADFDIGARPKSEPTRNGIHHESRTCLGKAQKQAKGDGLPRLIVGANARGPPGAVGGKLREMPRGLPGACRAAFWRLT